MAVHCGTDGHYLFFFFFFFFFFSQSNNNIQNKRENQGMEIHEKEQHNGIKTSCDIKQRKKIKFNPCNPLPRTQGPQGGEDLWQPVQRPSGPL